MSFKWKVVVVLLVVAVIIPFALRNQEYFVNIFIMIFLMGYLGTAWGLVGQSGQLSFGHSALFGIGAYTSTIIFRETGITPFVGMWLGVVLAAGFGLIVGYPTLRLRGAYFSLATLAFAYILQIVTAGTMWLGPYEIRGSVGVGIPLVNAGDAPIFFQFLSKTPYYFIALAMLVGVVSLSYILNRTRIGYYWQAIRGEQDAAESLGINAGRYRLLAMLLSSMLTALGGTFYAQYYQHIDPIRSMGVDLSIEIALVGIVGGWQTVFGPVVGSFVITPLGRLIRGELGATFPGVHLLIYGVILMLFILFLPKGLNAPLMRGLRMLEDKVRSRSRAVRAS